MPRYISTQEIVAIIIIVLLFITSTYFSGLYQVQIAHFMQSYNTLGMIAYVVFAIFETVVAPVSTLPLLPVAVASWGNFFAAILSIIAWTIGSVFAFLIAKEYGRPLLGKLLDTKRAEALARGLSSTHIFWTVLFARMVIPVDLLSYAVGLFVPIKLSHFTLATFIGITPFAFVFAYSATLPILYVIFIGLGALLLMFLGFRYFIKKGELEKRS